MTTTTTTTMTKIDRMMNSESLAAKVVAFVFADGIKPSAVSCSLADRFDIPRDWAIDIVEYVVDQEHCRINGDRFC